MSAEDGHDVLHVLMVDEPLPPSKVDLVRAVRGGRARERARRIAGTGAVAALTVLALAGAAVVYRGIDHTPPPPETPVSSTRTTGAPTAPKMLACPASEVRLPMAGRAEVQMDPTGRFLAGYVAVTDSGPRRAVLWTDGEPQYLNPPDTAPAPMAVNATGMVAGESQRDGRSIGWLYRDGQYIELVPPSGMVQTFVNGINAHGDVVGQTLAANQQGSAVLWSAARNWQVKVLPSGGATDSSAYAIGDDGTAYGTLGDGDQAYAWHPNGTAGALPGLDGNHIGKVFHVAGDWAYGVGSALPSGEARWVRWNLRTGEVVWPTDIRVMTGNARGWMVGVQPGPRPQGQPMILRDEGPQTLEPLRDLSYAIFGDVMALSDDGKVALGTLRRADMTNPSLVVWHC